MLPKKVYEAEDGFVFDTKEACERHEKEIGCDFDVETAERYIAYVIELRQLRDIPMLRDKYVAMSDKMPRTANNSFSYRWYKVSTAKDKIALSKVYGNKATTEISTGIYCIQFIRSNDGRGTVRNAHVSSFDALRERVLYLCNAVGIHHLDCTVYDMIK